jgi:CRP-like cAMP-binding protein
VTRDEVLQALGSWLRTEYGKLIVVREVRRVRRAAGVTWVANAVVPAPEGDIAIGALEIDEDGTILEPLGLEKVLEALRAPVPSAPRSGDAVDDGFGELLGDFGDIAEPPSRLDSDFEGLDPETLYQKAAAMAAQSDPASLHKARELMPRLLADPDRRGAVLVWMAVIERRLDQIPIALRHLEAAAREFADRFDLPTLEKLAALSLELMGPEHFETSPIKRMLEDGREKLRPVGTIFECPQFSNLGDDDRDWLGDSVVLRTLKQGEDLVREGEPSRNVFVVKSGLIGVHLEKPEGGTRLVRSCYPGWLLGESSVLVPDDPRCSATLRAEQDSEVWVIDAAILKDVMKVDANVRYRIEATKHLHRIDSFFSMHDTMGQLDALVRDDMLACIQRIQNFDADAPVIVANEEPKVACLILRGEMGVKDGDKELATIHADRFLGVRDAMHAIAPATTAWGKAGAQIALFDAAMLRALGEKSEEHVIAVLERLG